MPQRAIRFPEDVYVAIEAEAKRLGHPHTFSSIVVNTMRSALSASETPDYPRQNVSPEDITDAPTFNAQGKSLPWGPLSTTPADGMCSTCAKHGPPKTRPCAKCGHQR